MKMKKKKNTTFKERRASVKERLRTEKDVATWVGASQPARKQKEEERPERHVRYETHSVTSVSTISTLVESPKALDGGYGWFVTAYSFMLHFIADGLTFSFGMIFHHIVHKFHIDRWLASLVGSVFLALPLTLGPVASIFTDKLGCRISVIIGLALCAAGGLFSCVGLFLNSIVIFLLGFGIFLGTGLSFVYNAAIVMVSLFFEKKVALATSMAVSGTGVGTMVFPHIISFLEGISPEHSTLLLCAFIVAMCSISLTIAGVLLRDPEWTSDDFDWKKKKFDKNVRKLDRERDDDDDLDVDGALGRRAYSEPNLSTFCKVRGSILDLGIGSVLSIKESLNIGKQVDAAVPRSRSVGTFMRKVFPTVPEYTMLATEDMASHYDHLEHLDLQMTSSPANTIHCKPRIRMLSKTSMSVDAINDFDDDASHVKIGFYSESEDELEESRSEEEHSSESDSDMSNDGESSESDLSDRCLNKKVANGTTEAKKAAEVTQRKVESARQARPSIGTGHNAPGRVLVSVNAYRTRINTNMIEFQGKIPSAPLLAHTKKKWYMKYETLKPIVEAILQIPKEFPVYKKMASSSLCFMLFLISVTLLYMVLDVPYVFFYDYAVDTLKLPEDECTWLPSVIGFFNLVSTWVIGFIADRQFMKENLFLLYGFCIMGVASCMFGSAAASAFPHMVITCAFFGLFISANYVLQSVLLSYLFPEVSKFMSAYALSSFVEGIATLIGPPVVGAIRDYTGQYHIVFVVAGVLVALSSLLSLIIHFKLLQERRGKLSRDSSDAEAVPLYDHA